MSSLRIRPRFRKVSDHSPKEIEEHLKERLEDPECPFPGEVMDGYAIFKIPMADRHYWSPQLTMTIVDEEDEGTIIRGLYGPNANVWGLFIFGYSTFGIVGLFIAIIGFSKFSLGQEAPILWALPVLAGLALALYLIGQFGQKMGAQQTFDLHHFFEKAIGERVRVN